MEVIYVKMSYFLPALAGFILFNSFLLGGVWKDAELLGGKIEKATLWLGLLLNIIAANVILLIAAMFAWKGESFAIPYSDSFRVCLYAYFFLWGIVAAFLLQMRDEYKDYTDSQIGSRPGFGNYGKIHALTESVMQLGAPLWSVKHVFASIEEDGSFAIKTASFCLRVVFVVLGSGFLVPYAFVRYFVRRRKARIEAYMRTLQLSRV